MLKKAFLQKGLKAWPLIGLNEEMGGAECPKR